MIMMRYQPWSFLNAMQRDATQALHARAGKEGRQADTAHDAGDSCDSSNTWTPAVDICEEENRYVIFADVPGIEAKDIDIHTEKGVLSIKGKRSPRSLHSPMDANQQGQYRCLERARGTFERRFTVPDAVDLEHVSARAQNGVLEVVIPKTAKLQPRKIVVAG